MTCMIKLPHQRALTAQITSGGRIRPGSCWLGLVASEHRSWGTGCDEAS